jgi:DNA-binding XRE family transcriptional regulator
MDFGEWKELAVSASVVPMEPVRAGRALITRASDFRDIGRRIIAGRKVRGMRPTDLAATIGVGTNVLAMWETGQRRPNIEHAAMLIAVFGTTLDWLYFGRDEGLDWQVREKLLAMLETITVDDVAHQDDRRKLTGSE